MPSPLQNQGHGRIDDDLTDMVTDAVNQFSGNRGSARTPCQVPVSTIQHMPKEEADQGPYRRPQAGQHPYGEAGAGRRGDAADGNLIRRRLCLNQNIDQSARHRVHQIAIGRLFDLAGSTRRG